MFIYNKFKIIFNYLKKFINKYSIDELSSEIKSLFLNFIKNIFNTGNIFFGLVIIPPAILILIFIQAIIIVKIIIRNIFNLFQSMLKLITRVFTEIVKEINFYWIEARDVGVMLVLILNYLFDKISEYFQYQIKVLLGSNKEFVFAYDEPILIVVFHLIRKLVVWLVLFFIALNMTIILMIFPPLALVLRFIRNMLLLNKNKFLFNTFMISIIFASYTGIYRFYKNEFFNNLVLPLLDTLYLKINNTVMILIDKL